MKITYDLTKDRLNISKHGLSLSQASELDLDTALVLEDNRYDYGEKRYNAIGFIGNRLHVLTFATRSKDMRVISLRKANAREVKKYGKKIY